MNVRGIEHTCPLCGSMTLVEVQESDIPYLIEPSKAFVGMSLKYHKICTACKDTGMCQPVGLREGDRILITSIVGKKPCQKGQMVEVRIKRE